MNAFGKHRTGTQAPDRPDAGRRRPKRGILQFLRARQGVTAMEAAFILPVFFGFCFGFLETSMLYFSASVLEGQVADAARQIRTGNVQQSSDPEVTFRDILCGGHLAMLKCDDIVIDVRNFSDFGGISYPPIYDEDDEPTGAAFEPGSAGAVVAVRAVYRWKLVTPLLGHLLGDGGSDTRLLGASAIFRTEPYL